MRLLILLLLALRTPVAAQPKAPWPRSRSTNRIEFNGQLKWPDSIKNEPARQALAWRWYRHKLTNEPATKLRQLLEDGETTYAGVPQMSCYTLGILNADQERFRLCFNLLLTPTTAGITYRISDFNCYYSSVDSGTQQRLEEVLILPDARIQAIMEGFHQRLLLALLSW